MSTFCALHGQDTHLLLKETTIPSKLEEVNQLKEQGNDLLRDLLPNLLKAQDQIQSYVNSHRRELPFKEAFLKLQSYKMHSLAKKTNE